MKETGKFFFFWWELFNKHQRCLGPFIPGQALYKCSMVWKRSATYLYKIWAFINRSLFTETHWVQPLRLMGTVTLHSCLQTHRQRLCLNCPSTWLDTNSDGRKVNSYYPRQSCLEYRHVFEWRLSSKDFQKLRDCVQHCILDNLLSFLSFVQNLSQTSDSKGSGPFFTPPTSSKAKTKQRTKQSKTK